nr:MAG TPA: hypothetical protein [Caudoviricetes sp.]
MPVPTGQHTFLLATAMDTHSPYGLVYLITLLIKTILHLLIEFVFQE